MEQGQLFPNVHEPLYSRRCSVFRVYALEGRGFALELNPLALELNPLALELNPLALELNPCQRRGVKSC